MAREIPKIYFKELETSDSISKSGSSSSSLGSDGGGASVSG